MRPIKQVLCEHEFTKENPFKCVKCDYVIPLIVQDLIKQKGEYFE